MAIHLLTAIAVTYGTVENQNLIKSQRNINIQGFYTLSDLIVGDVFITQWNTLSKFDKVYAKSVQWDKIYIPSIRENAIIYKNCYEWYKSGPVPILTCLDDFITNSIDTKTITNYIRASVAASGALRALMGHTTREIEILCEHILLSIGFWIESESNIRGIILNEVSQRKQNRFKHIKNF